MKFSSYPYSRPDIEHLKADFKTLLNNFNASTTAAMQLDAMKAINNLRSQFDTMYQICSIRHSIDTRDDFYAAEQDFFDENTPSVEALASEYYQALISSPFRDAIEAHFGKQLFRIAEMQLRAFKPEIIEDLIIENKLSTEYQELIANASIPLDGEEKTLAEMTPYLRSTDRSVRERAADKMYKEDGSETSFKVMALFSVLQEKLVGAREMHQAKGGDGEFRAIATIICDKNIPYRIIAEVVNTMGQAGIENMRFAIMQGERWVP